MSLKDVLDRFALVSGLEQEEVSKWVFIIIDCIKYFEKNLRKSDLSNDEEKRLSYACATFAYYKYSLCKSAHAHSFKAGDVQIKESSDLIERARALWQLQKSEVEDLVSFDFSGFMRVSV